MPIILLNTKTINRIAAGEVIERPASVVKELVENSIDAQSTKIEIKIEAGGRNFISVADDGVGIEKEEIELAFLRHATSKLNNDDNLVEIKHLGFRGEALPSIAAVSRIRLSSKANGAEEAWSINYEGGEKTEELFPCSLVCGTQFEVRDLFFATPNRLKFLKTERAETQHIVDIINNLAMINYHVSFTLTSGNKKLLEYTQQPSLLNRLHEIEKEFKENSLEVYEQDESIKLTGHICKATVNRGRSDMIYTFVNKRPIKDSLLIGAVKYAYHDLIPSGRYPLAVLHLEIPYDQVDVNVHPNKTEVRFQNKRLIYELVRRGLIKALSARITVKQDLDPFTAGSSPEKKETHEFINVNNKREYYDRRPSAYENSVIREFTAPTQEIDKLVKEAFTKDDKISHTEEFFLNKTSEKERQTELIENNPLGQVRCQVYNTYIIAQAKDKIIVVDQHAAHERLVYENLKQKSNIKMQLLLMPVMVEVKNQEGMELLEKYVNKLIEIGFNLEINSENQVIVKAIPAILGNINAKEMLLNIIDMLLEIEDTLPMEDGINKILATVACHWSIRAGREMRLDEMNALLRQMEKTPYSGQCNHGRPTYVELKLSDIEKWFERR
ncbi:MAG: DNA mismatch repair endonuclease MutL [Wolbachia endosymbiont of Fragariocoptes setiger]|nr:DNA mismatch repair endonuclease MutL [Wolbachia endosymbiont of Fragariocoptes setiger]